MSTEEKSIGKKILSFFIQDVPESSPATPSQSVTPEPQATPVSQNVVRPSETNASTDKKFVDHFVQLLEKANLPGADYFEFMQTMKSLSGLGLSEEKQFQAAWASFRTMGGVSDINILVNTANQYVQILENDKTAFLKDADAAIKERVGNLQNQVKQMQDENKQMAEQIIALQKKIEQNNSTIEKVSGDIEEQSAKINNNKAGYQVTHDFFVDQIKSDIFKIQEHLLK
ncbi:hypothetical protein [Flectobacillus rivi]|uniref:Uncharacterized protein n=1 Tax=Flectobacillus rivi TaxID=2984209 RepID=A0ABT6Z6N7_9BACT|nr:hypothetical protein [Flectobacillus rivi]MDI9876792.1 hypothetical protein [Flectobacillus rivi]